MKRKIFLIILSAFLLAGCGKIPTLKNGEQAVVSFADGGISANELYEEIKNTYGLEALVTMSDTYVLEKEFKGYKANASEQAKSTIDSLTESYGGKDELLQAIKSNTNYTSIEAYENVVYLSYMREHATLEYAKEQLTDKEIKKYYDDNIYGDVSVNHILITADVKSDATAEEKTKAQNEAKKKAEEVISKLKAAKDNKKDVLETFKSLAKEYSEDAATKEKGGELGYINYNTLGSSYNELVTAALDLKDNSFSTKVITTELGYHIIYRNDQKEKASLDKVKDEIKETLATKQLNENSGLVVDALQYYRKKNKMEIHDSELQKQYANYIQSLVTSSMSSNK